MKTTDKKLSDVIAEALMNKEVAVYKIAPTQGMQGGQRLVGSFQKLGDPQTGKVVAVRNLQSSAVIPFQVDVMVDKKIVIVQVDAFTKIPFV